MLDNFLKFPFPQNNIIKNILTLLSYKSNEE